MVRRAVTQHEVMRRAHGYSVTGLARAIGFSHTYVSRVEGGLAPSGRYRKAVCQLLEVPEVSVFPNVGVQERST